MLQKEDSLMESRSFIKTLEVAHTLQEWLEWRVEGVIFQYMGIL